MKRALFCLFLALVFLCVGATQTGRFFNVVSYGATPNDTTDDAAAIKLAVDAWNANGAGGVLYVPSGEFRRVVVDPATDTNDFSSGSLSWFIDVGGDNQTVLMEPDARLRVIANFNYSSDVSASPPGSIAVLGPTSTKRDNFTWRGGRATWEDSTLGGIGTATRSTAAAGSNGAQFMNFYGYNALFENLIIDGFPVVGTVLPYTYCSTSGGPAVAGTCPGSDPTNEVYSRVSNTTFRKVQFLNWGGAGHDNGPYVYGGTLLEDCRFSTNRTNHSHGLYFGPDSPNVTVRHCEFENIGNDTLGSKYAIHVYGQSGGRLRDFVIEDNVFRNCWRPIIIHKDDGATGSYNGRIIGNTFWGRASYTAGLAIYGARLNNVTIAGNYFSGWVYRTILLSGNSGSGADVTIRDNRFEKTNAPIETQDHSGVQIVNNLFTAPTGSSHAISLNPAGHDAYIAGNRFLNWTSSGSIGIAVTGDRARIVDNQYTTTGGGTAGAFIYLSGNNGTVRGNKQESNATNGNNQILGQNNKIEGNYSNQVWDIGPTGGVHEVIGNHFTAVPIFSGAGKVYAYNNTLAGVSTLTSLQYGSGNRIGSGDLLDTLATSYTASWTPDAGLYRIHTMTLTGNVTVNAPTHPVTGAQLTFVLTNDGTSGRTITWNAVFKVNCTPDTAAGKINSFSFTYNGTNWIQTGCNTGL